MSTQVFMEIAESWISLASFRISLQLDPTQPQIPFYIHFGICANIQMSKRNFVMKSYLWLEKVDYLGNLLWIILNLLFCLRNIITIAKFCIICHNAFYSLNDKPNLSYLEATLNEVQRIVGVAYMGIFRVAKVSYRFNLC